MLRTVGHGVLNALFPPACMGCGKALPITSGYTVCCTACRRMLIARTWLHCPACTAPVRGMHASCHPRVAYVFGGAVSYDLPLAQTLIRALKFQGIRSAAVPLGALIVEYIEALGLLRQGHRVPVIVPVPLSIERQRMRGFDQAALIAQEVADRMRLPLRTGLLQRVRHTPPQTSMHGRDAREHNLAGCFAVGTDSPAPGAPIFLVDDVVTTGTTMAEAARTIRSRHDGPLICLAAAQA